MEKKSYTKQVEERRKKVIFDEINELIPLFDDIQNSIQESHKNFGLGKVNFPNIVIYANNKIGEISNIFNSAHLSMYIDTKDSEIVFFPSNLGDAIIEDIFVIVNEAINKLKLYNKVFDLIVKQKISFMSNPFSKLFTSFRYVYNGKNPLQFTEEEANLLDSYLNDYIMKAKSIWNYSLDKDLQNAVLNKILNSDTLYKQPPVYTVYFLISSIFRDLISLGYESLIPSIMEEIMEKYEYSEELMTYIENNKPEFLDIIKKSKKTYN